MDLNEVYDMIQRTGYPVAYDHFDSAPPMPYILYRVTGTRNFSADNGVFFRADSIDVELYTKKKDPTAEKKLEMALNGLCWESTGTTYIDTEKLYQTIYEIEV